MQRFLRHCVPGYLVLALKGANSEVSNKIFQNMSTRMAQSIRYDLKIYHQRPPARCGGGPEQRIVGIIRQFWKENELIILKGGKGRYYCLNIFKRFLQPNASDFVFPDVEEAYGG